MERDVSDDGTLAGLPWASVFDPASNLRALGEIQRRGLNAAGEVVERLVRSVDGQSSAAAGSFGDEASDEGNPDLENLAKSWAWLFQRVAGSWGDMFSSSAAGPHASIDLGLDASDGSLQLGGDNVEAVTGEVWLHNPLGTAIGDVVLRSGELLSHTGSAIPASAVSFDPAEAISMPPRSSRGIVVHVDVRAAATGIYRGTLLVQDHPDAWLPFVVVLGLDAG